VPLNDAIYADCPKGLFTDFVGDKHQFRGKNPRAGNSGPKYILLDLSTRQVADGSSASGYDVNMDLERFAQERLGPPSSSRPFAASTGADHRLHSAEARALLTSDGDKPNCRATRDNVTPAMKAARTAFTCPRVSEVGTCWPCPLVFLICRRSFGEGLPELAPMFAMLSSSFGASLPRRLASSVVARRSR
jgi:hypothetical protein